MLRPTNFSFWPIYLCARDLLATVINRCSFFHSSRPSRPPRASSFARLTCPENLKTDIFLPLTMMTTFWFFSPFFLSSACNYCTGEKIPCAWDGGGLWGRASCSILSAKPLTVDLVFFTVGIMWASERVGWFFSFFLGGGGGEGVFSRSYYLHVTTLFPLRTAATRP